MRLIFVCVGLLASGGAATLAACSGGGEPPAAPVGTSEQATTGTCAVPPQVDRSLFVTDSTALANFPLESVLAQIVTTGGNPSQSALGLYQQMMDTLNDKDGGVTNGPHCDDQTVGDAGAINGFPEQFCPRQEGTLAKTDPFAPVADGGTNPDSYIPVGLVDRFDLAPANGDNCGQYRVVYGKVSGLADIFNRMLIIFEAVLPNPDRAKGIAGCLPVAQFWDDLSKDNSASHRATLLQKFYFKGFTSGTETFPPVIAAQHYGIGGGTNTGQIRANMFMNQVLGQEWELREFRLSQTCPEPAGACTLIANNTVVQDNPFGALFGGTDQRSLNFQTEFLTQISSLSATTIPGIAMTTPFKYDGPQSDEQVPTNNDYFPQSSKAFLATVTEQLVDAGSGLTAENILDRATTQSCAGCHELAVGRNLGPGNTNPWPRSNGFTQVNEDGGLSLALTGSFLPARAAVLTNFIDHFCGDAGGGGIPQNDNQTIGGGLVGSSN